jgi:hypothetical protein
MASALSAAAEELNVEVLYNSMADDPRLTKIVLQAGKGTSRFLVSYDG